MGSILSCPVCTQGIQTWDGACWQVLSVITVSYKQTDRLTNPQKLSLRVPTDSHAIPHILWRLSVHDRPDNSPPLSHIMNQKISIHFLPILGLNWTLFSHLPLGLPRGTVLSRFPTNHLYAFMLYPIHATYLAHLTLLDLTTRTVLIILFLAWTSGAQEWQIHISPAVLSPLPGSPVIDFHYISYGCMQSVIFYNLLHSIIATWWTRVLLKCERH